MKNGKQSNLNLCGGNEFRFLQEYGNCLGGDTKVSVFDTELNEYKEITLKELYKSI
jgi:hypothetical protein